MSDWDDGEPLGYKRPPKWGRFQKGQSGNPKGRPKKARKEESVPAESELDRIQREALDQQLTVKEGGVTKKRKAIDVVAKAQINSAIKGHPMAQREVLKSAAELEKREEMRKAKVEQQIEDKAILNRKVESRIFEHFVALKEKQKKAWDEALAEGLKEPDFPWPHPDDIKLDYGRKKYRLIGPMDETGVPLFEFQRAERDVAFLRMVIAFKARAKSDQKKAEFWAAVFGMHDAGLPARWKIGESFQSHLLLHHDFSVGELKVMLSEDLARSARWKQLAGLDRRCKHSYKVVNQAMRPLLQSKGYKSLAHFERAYEDTNGDPPWPLKGG